MDDEDSDDVFYDAIENVEELKILIEQSNFGAINAMWEDHAEEIKQSGFGASNTTMGENRTENCSKTTDTDRIEDEELFERIMPPLDFITSNTKWENQDSTDIKTTDIDEIDSGDELEEVIAGLSVNESGNYEKFRDQNFIDYSIDISEGGKVPEGIILPLDFNKDGKSEILEDLNCTDNDFKTNSTYTVDEEEKITWGLDFAESRNNKLYEEQDFTDNYLTPANIGVNEDEEELRHTSWRLHFDDARSRIEDKNDAIRNWLKSSDAEAADDEIEVENSVLDLDLRGFENNTIHESQPYEQNHTMRPDGKQKDPDALDIHHSVALLDLKESCKQRHQSYKENYKESPGSGGVENFKEVGVESHTESYNETFYPLEPIVSIQIPDPKDDPGVLKNLESDPADPFPIKGKTPSQRHRARLKHQESLESNSRSRISRQRNSKDLLTPAGVQRSLSFSGVVQSRSSHSPGTPRPMRRKSNPIGIHWESVCSARSDLLRHGHGIGMGRLRGSNRSLDSRSFGSSKFVRNDPKRSSRTSSTYSHHQEELVVLQDVTGMDAVIMHVEAEYFLMVRF